MLLLVLVLCATIVQPATAQTFLRSELPTELVRPWEMQYGADGYLWISESGGTVSRVHPQTGEKQTVHVANDYSWGDSTERLPYCRRPAIAAGTLGLALHPDFPKDGGNFIYYVYSYNQGTKAAPATRFKIVRLTWDTATESATEVVDLVLNLPSGHDHPGGRLIAVRRPSGDFLIYSAGDGGLSDDNDPGCYPAPVVNPNVYAQDPLYPNGKIHRFTMDGGIPEDNPIPGNSMITRGHRNPQGLVYSPRTDVLYEIEHGDRSDDEINILEYGKNYGWKNVRGYHDDDNFPGELTYVRDYQPHPLITQDALVPPLWSWCAQPQPSTDSYLDWCTVAPSDGVYYDSDAIREWDNSLLVVTLKDGIDTDKEVYQFALTSDGRSLRPATPGNPNPKRFFGEDQDTNGRLRDIAVSPDGGTIYLINNGGVGRDKIAVYQYAGPTSADYEREAETITMFPNPALDRLSVTAAKPAAEIIICDALGQQVRTCPNNLMSAIDLGGLPPGVYWLHVRFVCGTLAVRSFVRR